MGDISESIVKIIYTNNVHMFFKAQKYGGGGYLITLMTII